MVIQGGLWRWGFYHRLLLLVYCCCWSFIIGWLSCCCCWSFIVGWFCSCCCCCWSFIIAWFCSWSFIIGRSSCGRLLSTATLAKACTCRKHYTTIHTFFCLACNAAARLPLAAVRTAHGIIWDVPLTEHAKFCLWGDQDRSCFFGLV